MASARYDMIWPMSWGGTSSICISSEVRLRHAARNRSATAINRGPWSPNQSCSRPRNVPIAATLHRIDERGAGAGDQIALQVIAAQVAEDLGLARGLDPLADHPHAAVPAQ